MKRVIFILLLVFLGGISQAQELKDIKWKYTNGTGDGFDISVTYSYIVGVSYPERVCVGDMALFTIQMGGGSLFAYKWYKGNDQSDVLSSDSYLIIDACTMANNGDEYWCEVTDLASGETLVMDEPIVLNVVEAPTVILRPWADTTICYGETIRLTAQPADDAYFYSWEGKGVVNGAHTHQVNIKPEESTIYTVVVSDGTCSASASVKVNVRKPVVKLPEDIVYLGDDGKLELTPISDSRSGVFNWKVEGNTLTNQPVLSTVVSSITTVVVTLQDSRCSASDSCLVYPGNAFARFNGGDHDGFVETKKKLSTSGVSPAENRICLGGTAYFSCNVDLTSTFTFQWWKVGDGGPDAAVAGATEQILTLEATTNDVAGEYYCRIIDQDSKEEVKTQPVKLFIYDIPEINISQPTGNTAICPGAQIVLKADRPAGEGERLLWAGYNILTNPTLQEITVAPTDTTVYELMLAKISETGNRIICRSTHEVRIDVRKLSVQIDKMVNVLKGESYTFAPEVTPGAVYTWSVNGNKTIASTLTITPTDNTVVYLEKKLGNDCYVNDSCRVFVKEYGVGSSATQDEDGYAETILPFYIRSVECPKKVCEHSQVLLNIEVNGYDVYEYTWKKRTSSTTTEEISKEQTHLINNVTLANAGTYFCEVREVRSGKTLPSEDVKLEVLEIPDAEVRTPVNGKWICKGESIALEAFNAGTNVTYLWEGINIISGANTMAATVAPTESTTYSLVVDNGTCVSVAYHQINVQDISIDIPEVVYANSGSPVKIKPLSQVVAGAEVTWSWDGQQLIANEFQKNLAQSTVVQATLVFDGCHTSDSTRVYIRSTSAFRNGEEDGYVESNVNFRILEFSYPAVVCENVDAEMSVRLRGSGVYSYAWREKGNNTILSEESNFKFANSQLSDIGRRFYCSITDLMAGVTLTTDTMTLQVRKGPKAIIGYPDRGKRYCKGTTIKLDARDTENSKDTPETHFVYSWEGENVAETENDWTVMVSPEHSQLYTLKVSVDGCVDYDTISIFILEPKVIVPSVAYAIEGEMLSVNAQVENVSTNATINWWHDALFIPDKNPYTVNIKQSAILVAEVVEEGCVSTDTTRVYVRSNKYYNGGDDDGFMESCDIPVIDQNVDKVLGCGGADSVSLVVAFSGSPKEFRWQKLNTVDGTYADMTEPADGHIKGFGSSILTIDPLSGNDYGKYRCILSNDCGNAYSPEYTVANGNVPQLIPGGRIDTIAYCEGIKNQQIVIPVDDESSISDISYRWYKKNLTTKVVQQFTPEESYNDKVFKFPEIAVQHDALYYIEAENACGITKDSIRLLVTRKVALERQPNDTLVCVNTPVRLTVRAKDGGLRAYSLKKVIPESSLFVGYKVEKVLTSDANNTYKFASITRADEGYYVWTVKASCGDSISTNMFKVTVDNPLQFTSWSKDTTMCYGTTLSLGAIAESPDCPASKIIYSWEKVGEGKLPYATSAISFPFTEGKEGEYICRAKNVCSEIPLNNSIKVKAHPALVITKIPTWESAGICEGKSMTVNFAVNIPSVVDSVRWFRKSNGIYTPVYNALPRVTGADYYKLTVDTIRLSESGEYRARAYNVCGVFETSIGAMVKVDTAARIIKDISDFFPKNNVCQGYEADLKVEAIGKMTLFYSWYINDNLVMDATSNQLRVTFDSLARYECRIHNYCATDNSIHTVNVIKADTFRFQAVNSNHYCDGSAGVQLQLVGTDTNYLYKLYKKTSATATPKLIMQKSAKEASYLFGALNFGTHQEGIYYVEGFNNRTLCEATMPGIVTVVKDTLPKAFNAFIIDPICQGEVAGEIALDGSTYTTNEAIKYMLKQKQTDGTWKQLGLIKPGTDDTLYWNSVLAGIYRIEATNFQTRCSTWMNNELDLQARPLPEKCTLELLKGDSVYCSEDKIEVVLQMKPACVKDGLKYTLKKDNNLLADRTLIHAPIQWDTIKPGKYSVEIKNEWGCSVESNPIHIKVLPVPAKKTLKGNHYYCVATAQEGVSTPITLLTVDPKVKYEFFRTGETTPIDVQYKGVNANIITNVAEKDAVYYVVATDTANKCSTRMANTVFVKGGRLFLDHDQIVMDKANAEVRLNLIVKDTIGRPTILWEPSAQIIQATNPKRPWMDMSDLSKNRFTATVTDSACTASLNVSINFSGDDLTAAIKDPRDCTTDIPKDTLWICAGVNFSLCGNITGGNGVYGYEWKHNNKVLGSGKSLSQVSVDTSGYLVFRVGSGGRIAKDSIRMEVFPSPGKGLIMPAENMCAAPGQNIEIPLRNTRENVVYRLDYSSTGEVYSDGSISETADASGMVTLSCPFTNASVGYYRVKATYNYGNGNECHSNHYRVHVRRGTYKGMISGGGIYCTRPDKDTIVLDTTEKMATYRLIYKAEGSSQFVEYNPINPLKGTDKALQIVDNLPNGVYKIVAERQEGACVDTMFGEVLIRHLERPNPGILVSDPMEYCIKDGVPLAVQISLSGCLPENSYKLFRRYSSSIESVGRNIIGEEGEVVFGMAFDKPGRYFSVADNGNCKDTAGYVLISQLPEIDITLVKVDTGYCVGEEKPVVSLEIYPAETGLHYYIYPEHSTKIVGEFKTFVEDTAYFSGALTEGKYIVKAVIADCDKDIETPFTIKEFRLPDNVNLMKPITSCEGTLLAMGVEGSQEGVSYELFREIDGSIAQSEGKAYGNGALLKLAELSNEGVFYIQVEDTLTHCGRKITGYEILPAPQQFQFMAADTSYCAFNGESGTQLGISGTEFGVNYILQKFDVDANQYLDAVPQVSITGVGLIVPTYFDGIHKAGKYRVRTSTCNGAIIGNELEIKEVQLPNANLVVKIGGKACIDSTMLVTLVASEKDVQYSLWKGNTSYGSTLTGTDADIDWTLNNVQGGEYQIRATRKGDNNASCPVVLKKHLNVKGLPLIDVLNGSNTLCEFATTTLKLTNVESGVKYLLMNRVDDDTVCIGTVSPTVVQFTNIKPGAYYAIAENGDCRNYSPVLTIAPVSAPKIEDVRINYTECALPYMGVITIADMADTLSYYLKQPNGSEDKLFDNSVKDLELGVYYLRVQGRNLCYSKYDTIRMNNAIPTADTLIGNFGYCVGEAGARLVLGKSTVNVRYSIHNAATGNELEAILGGIGKSFLKSYVEDQYIFKAKRQGNLGGCEIEKTFTVEEYDLPSGNLKIEVDQPAPFCAGGAYQIVVKSAQAGVAYILKKDQIAVDTLVTTTSGDATFDAISASGVYTILPKRGGVCGTTPLDTTIVIHKQPKQVYAEQPCSYCNPAGATVEIGAQLHIYDAVEGVRYILKDATNDLDTVRGNYNLSFLTYKAMKVGDYYIFAEDTLTGCSAYVDTAKITKNIDPVLFTCGTDGDRCGESVTVGTSDGCEVGVEYYLYRDGVKVKGPIVKTAVENVSFGLQTDPGIYKIYAQYPGGGCGTFMNDSIVVYKQLIRDTISVKGSYCEGGDSDIALRVRESVPNWSYYIEKDGVHTDTLKGTTDGSPLRWSSLGGNDLRAGIYRLYAINVCGDKQKLDTVVIDTNHRPAKYTIREGNYTICSGSEGTITLSNSSSLVSYTLTFTDGISPEKSLATKDGINAPLLMAKVQDAGIYRVMASMKATGCSDTMDVVKLRSIQGIPDPGIIASDLCQDAADSKSLIVKLTDKELVDIHYYLKWMGVTDTLMVDSIKFGNIADINRTEFIGQKQVGQYQVIAIGPTCQRTFPAARIGKEPVVQNLAPVGVQTICKGKTVELKLENTEKGVSYELYKIIIDKPDSSVVSTGLIVEGTDNPLKIGDISAEGRYIVKAKNGCIVDMQGEANLKVSIPPSITLEKDGYTICATNDSVKIEILGRTNPNQNAQYLIYPPSVSVVGGSGYVDAINAGANQASVKSNKWFKTPGYYKIYQNDNTNCPAVDSVKIEVLQLPNVYTLSAKGNTYICGVDAKKQLILNGAQRDVDYHLYRKVGNTLESVTMIASETDQDQLVFEVSMIGTYVVEAKYNNKPKGCPQRMQGEVTLTADPIAQYKLEAIVDAYCERPGVAQKGKVKLVNSNTGISYQLYKDGVIYGDPKTAATAGTPLIWDGLVGGLPKMSATQLGAPVKYKVVATNLATTCQVDMLGVVEVTGERTLLFSDAHMADDLPKCVGEPLQMEVIAYGGKIAYSWLKNNLAIPDANKYLYAKEKMEAGDMGNYSCVMENTCGKDTTRTLSVVPSLLVEKHTTGIDTITLCDLKPDEVKKQQVMSSVLNASQWEWYKGGVLIAGQNYKWIDVDVSLTQGAGIYTCRASNGCGEMWDTCVIAVDSTPYIRLVNGAVKKDTLCHGSTYKLEVNSNYPANWYKGATELNVVGNTLTINDINQTHAGSYNVIAINACGMRQMTVGSLVVDDTVKMISENDLFRVCRNKGDVPELFIQTAPQERVSYRWEDENGNVLSTTNKLLNIDLNKYNNHKEVFKVYYKNKCNVGSANMTMLISDSIRFTQPVQQIKACVVDLLQDTMLRVKVDEPRGITYKWYYSKRGEGAIGRDSVGNADTLHLDISTTKTAGFYYCYMANNCVDTTTRLVSVRIDTVPTLLSTLERTKSICAGNELLLTTKGSGGSITYNWYVKKKNKVAQMAFSETSFGVSESKYKSIIDTTYNGALIWCDLTNTCSKQTTDTMHLTVHPAPEVEMSPAFVEGCEGATSEIYIKFKKGEKPWQYKYSVNDVPESQVYSPGTKAIDTLKVSVGGVYRINWLKDNKCTVEGNELAVSEYKTYKVSKYSLKAVDYTESVCPGTTITFEVKIDGDVSGPWNLEIRRKSDNQPASELGFDGTPIYLTDPFYSCQLKVMKDEEYFAYVTNVFLGGMECVATPKPGENLVSIKMKAKPALNYTKLNPEDRIFGRCKTIDLHKLFNVTPHIGYYTIGGIEAPGDWMSAEQDKYQIGYRIFDGGCKYDYSLAELQLTPKPTVNLTTSEDVLCGSTEASTITMSAGSEYPVTVTYRIINLKRDGTAQLLATVPYVFANTTSKLNLNVVYDENLAGKIYEIVRVEDKRGCTVEEEVLSKMKDTVFMPQRPTFTLYSKVGGTTEWKTSMQQNYTVRRGDSVDVKVSLTGVKPWMVRFNEAIGGGGFDLSGIHENEKDLALKEPGLYEVAVADKYCTSIGAKPSISLKMVDTAHIKVKAYLQGPWVGNKMSSNVLAQINKRGLSAWPNVGSKKIIDWVEVELWTMDEKLWDSQACLLLDDGTVVDITGNSDLKLIGRGTANYRIALRARNHLAVLSVPKNLSQAVQTQPVTVDFTVPATIYVKPNFDINDFVYVNDGGVTFLYGGDINMNRLISAFDPNKIARELLAVDKLQATGAVLYDINYNGQIEWPGFNVDPTTGAVSQDDWAVMFKNRLKYTLVPERIIDWEQ